MYVHLSNRCAGDHSLERRRGATIRHLDGLTLAVTWNHSEVRCEVLPLPGVAAAILPGLAFAKAISSAVVRVGSRVLTTSRIGIVARIDTGTNALGSKLSFW